MSNDNKPDNTNDFAAQLLTGAILPGATKAPSAEDFKFGGDMTAATAEASGMAYGTAPATTESPTMFHLEIDERRYEATGPLPVAAATSAATAELPLLSSEGEMSYPVGQAAIEPGVRPQKVQNSGVSGYHMSSNKSLLLREPGEAFRDAAPRLMILGKFSVGKIDVEVIDVFGGQSVPSLDELPQMALFLFDIDEPNSKRGRQLFARFSVNDGTEIINNASAWGEMLYGKLNNFFTTDETAVKYLGARHKVVGNLFKPEQWLIDLAKTDGDIQIHSTLSVKRGGTRSTPWFWYVRLPHVPATVVLEPAGQRKYEAPKGLNEAHFSTVLQNKPYIVKVILHDTLNINLFFTVEGLAKAVTEALDTYLPMPCTWHHKPSGRVLEYLNHSPKQADAQPAPQPEAISKAESEQDRQEAAAQEVKPAE